MRSRIRCLLAVAAVLAAGVPAAGTAADLQISPGWVDPPDYPAASTSWTWQQVMDAWGPPTDCEFSANCTGDSSDIAFYPFRVIVFKDAAVNYMEVSSTAWSTPEGIRRLAPTRRLKAVYGTRLAAVRNKHRFVGKGSGPGRVDRTNYMVTSGNYALGFSMASGRVSTILTGSPSAIRQTLAMYGPI